MTEPAKQRDPYTAPNVPQLIGLIEDGDYNAYLAEKYRALIADMEAAAQDVGEKTKVKGELNLKLKLDLQGGVYDVVGEVAVKAPKRVPRRTSMYATEDNSGLSRNRPGQPDMFRPVEGTGDRATPARVV